MTTLPSALVKGKLTSIMTPGDTTPYTINMSAAVTGTSIANGDFVFIMIDSQGTTATSNTPAIPSGFREIVTWKALGTSTTTVWGVYAKRRVPGESDYTLVQTNVGRTNKLRVRVFWIDGSNADDVANWIIGSLQTRASSGGTFNTVAPSITTTDANAVAFAFGAERTTAAETEAQLTVSGTGWTKQLAFLGSSAAETTLTIASKPMVTAGATGAVTFTTVNTQSTNGEALQIIIPAFPDGPPTSVPGNLWDGTNLISGQWFVAGASDTVDTCSVATMIWPGYESIDAMLAEDFFYAAHRGGSQNWPEMSMQGYTQSALRGYGMLEVSVARSSDGVWFGLHDASLDRTSLGTGGGTGTTYVASGMTWSAIQTHDILPASGLPVNTTHQPYTLLDDILDAYLQSHVIMVDPKSASAFRSELIGILQNRPEWQDKIVAKFVPGSSTSSWLTSARAAGFVTNAMFYEEDNIATYHSQADILGMELPASSGTWTTILSYGKPVMAHVLQSTTHIADAMSKGAAGAMVARPVQVPLVTF